MTEITKEDVGDPSEGDTDRNWIGEWRLFLSPVGLFTGAPTVPDDRGELFFAKPRTIIFYRRSPISSFGGQCPGYQGVRWSIHGDRVVFSHPEGHCREYSLDALTFKPWTRVS